jgi:hypothetical protein
MLGLACLSSSLEAEGAEDSVVAAETVWRQTTHNSIIIRGARQYSLPRLEQVVQTDFDSVAAAAVAVAVAVVSFRALTALPFGTVEKFKGVNQQGKVFICRKRTTCSHRSWH